MGETLHHQKNNIFQFLGLIFSCNGWCLWWTPTFGECFFSNFFIQLLFPFHQGTVGPTSKSTTLAILGPSCGQEVTLLPSWGTAQHEIQPETSIYKWLFQVDDSKSLKKEMDEPKLSCCYNLFFAVQATQNHSLSFVQPTKNALFGMFFWVGFLFSCV